MDLSNPIRSVIPSAQGASLAVLARTTQPLSGRGVAALTDGQVSPKGVSLALRALVEAGLVLVEDHPPAKLYRLNRRHLAADAIVALADLRGRMINTMREQISQWDPAAADVWLFGSAARGEGAADSDIDVLLVRPDNLDLEDDSWTVQVEQFVDDVTAWTGNPCAVVEYSETEFAELLSSRRRLAIELRADAVSLMSGSRSLRPAGATR